MDNKEKQTINERTFELNDYEISINKQYHNFEKINENVSTDNTTDMDIALMLGNSGNVTKK